MIENRWPVTYDIEGLKQQIVDIKNNIDTALFYNYKEKQLSILCQGDIFELDIYFPYIDDNGEAVGDKEQMWVLIGNTCDMQRDIKDLEFTQIAPLSLLSDEDFKDNTNILEDLKNYQSYKKFYFQNFNKTHYILDFTKICTIHKQALYGVKKTKELTFESWVLFHCCLVRYLARDDGRHD